MMNTTNSRVLPAPPSLMKALMAGFDAITNHIGLIFFSITLDLLLWLGPHLRLADLIRSFFTQAAAVPEMNTPDMADMMRTSQELWQLVAQRFNLLSVLRTFPVGIPSLMMGSSPFSTPAGAPEFWEAPSLGVAVFLWLAITIVGLVAGAFYFTLVAQASLSDGVDWKKAIANWAWTSKQVLFLALFWLALVVGFSLPFSCLLSFILVSGFSLGRLALILFGGLVLWLLLPLVFSPHGIFVNGRDMWTSVKDSIRLTRMTLPSTGLFFLVIVVLGQGLDVLWRVPTETSWLTVIGVAGHAFVTTGLLAASFVYYRDADRWMQRLFQQARLAAEQDIHKT